MEYNPDTGRDEAKFESSTVQPGKIDHRLFWFVQWVSTIFWAIEVVMKVIDLSFFWASCAPPNFAGYRQRGRLWNVL